MSKRRGEKKLKGRGRKENRGEKKREKIKRGRKKLGKKKREGESNEGEKEKRVQKKGGEQQIFVLGRKNEKWGSFSMWEEKRKGGKKR